jgi:acetyl esterase/lipase
MSEDILDLPPAPADERLRYGEDPLQFGDLRLPRGDGPHPVVVYVHGGFWRSRYDLGHAGHPCAALTAAGIVTWNIEYRRIGNPGGGWPGTFDDVAAAADYVRTLAPRYNLDLERVVAVGHSAGGHLALWIAARRRIPRGAPLYGPDPVALRGAVSLAGVVDLREAWNRRLSNGVVRELIGGTPDETPDRYAIASPPQLLPLGVPQVLIHGTRDDSVPFKISAGYRESAVAAGDDATLVTLPGAGHFEPVDPRSAQWAETLAAVQGLVGGPR